MFSEKAKPIKVKCFFCDKSMRGNAQNVPESSKFRHMCLRDNLTDCKHCGGLQVSLSALFSVPCLFWYSHTLCSCVCVSVLFLVCLLCRLSCQCILQNTHLLSYKKKHVSIHIIVYIYWVCFLSLASNTAFR